MSHPKHPIITFQVNLTPPWNEQVGPNTNPNMTRVPCVDQVTDTHDENTYSNVYPAISPPIDRHIITDYFRPMQMTSWLPGFLCGENIEHKVSENGDSVYIVAFGQRATYLKDTYTTGDNPLLTVVSETYASASDAAAALAAQG